uniref:Potassium channel tetramerisation-type BTB domain-containing protein n=1 Tax=Solanum lycopersicum TaxID=4081 RepID=A0A3Q7H8I1_SOLLC
MGTPNGRVKLNVGGRIFETTTTTLEFAGKNSFFRAMLDDNWNSAINEHFIDTNPGCFGSRAFKIIELSAATDLRVGINYIPKEFLLDPSKLCHAVLFYFQDLCAHVSCYWEHKNRYYNNTMTSLEELENQCLPISKLKKYATEWVIKVLVIRLHCFKSQV